MVGPIPIKTFLKGAQGTFLKMRKEKKADDSTSLTLNDTGSPNHSTRQCVCHLIPSKALETENKLLFNRHAKMSSHFAECSGSNY